MAIRLKLRSVLFSAAIAVPLLLLMLTAGIAFCNAALRVQRSPVPDPATLTIRGKVSSAAITARDGARLSGWFITSGRESNRCVIVLHGIADSRLGSAGFAAMFLEAGYSVLAPDSRAHGSSGGEFVTYGLLEKYDVLDWAAWLRSSGCQSIYGLGESLGAATLIQACSLAPVFRAVVAESSYSDLRSVAEHRTLRYIGSSGVLSRIAARVAVTSGMIFARIRYGFELGQASPLNAISRSRTPILLIHGEADEDTPVSHSLAMAAANQNVVIWVVARAGHTAASAVAPEEFWNRVLAWFASH